MKPMILQFLKYRKMLMFRMNILLYAIRLVRELVRIVEIIVILFFLYSPTCSFCCCFACSGQIVYTSGFPHFASLGRLDNFLPSIFEGRITKKMKGVIFTDASVQSGQSGGPIFSQDGCLIGVCISNSKDDNNQLIYPNINMAVPVYDIFPILQKYSLTKGRSIES